ncbi:hypothetical protein XA68_11379 [Ophiocordyceps unilateralis]|uniref:Uncharacterized protein n=1 Tax=Ophiocordyceps unilateralis TaxID=268505 RepID=A0A2A9P248_OPHUN|nr:hypothetical protein XA68_11379 [Ophiocordyceps unilateralis]
MLRIRQHPVRHLEKCSGRGRLGHVGRVGEAEFNKVALSAGGVDGHELQTGIELLVIGGDEIDDSVADTIEHLLPSRILTV